MRCWTCRSTAPSGLHMGTGLMPLMAPCGRSSRVAERLQRARIAHAEASTPWSLDIAYSVVASVRTRKSHCVALAWSKSALG